MIDFDTQKRVYWLNTNNNEQTIFRQQIIKKKYRAFNLKIG